MADEMLNWDGSTIELPDNLNEAINTLDDLIKSNDTLDIQRIINKKNMITKHDWRYRIKDMCGLFGLEMPDKLNDDLGKLSDLSSSLKI